MKRVLVLTASFGDGHNTAANSIREALEFTGEAEVTVADLYSRAIPLVDRAARAGYSLAINRYPWIWELIFRALDQPGLMEKTLWTAGAMRRALEKELLTGRPDVIVSTYPLYGYLFREIQQSRLGVHMPFITVITDSTGINSAWYRCPSDAFVVADDVTADLLVARGVDRKRLHALGFPVSRAFSACESVPESAGAPPFKLLFMPSTKLVRTLRQIEALLEIPEVELTVIAGRHAKLHQAIEHSGYAANPRCRILGWTDQMPQLLCSHHAFIGKAGGAITQEAIAAQCPFFVSHVVPGQEEGNIVLIERLGVGVQALGEPDQLAERVRAAFVNDAETWRGWKRNLEAVRKPAAADEIARFVLEFSEG